VQEQAAAKASSLTLGGGAFARTTHEQMAAFTKYLQDQGWELQDCPGGENDCALYAVLSQAFNIVPDDTNTHSRMVVASYRRQLVHLLRELAVDEAWLVGITAMHDDAATPAAALQMHLAGLQAGAALTDVDLSALQRLLAPFNVRITLYSPTFPVRKQYKWDMVDNGTAPAAAVVPSGSGTGNGPTNVTSESRHVHIAHVWYGWLQQPSFRIPGTSGELNHYMVVRPSPACPGPGGSTPAAGAARPSPARPGPGGSTPAARAMPATRLPGPGSKRGSTEQQQAGDTGSNAKRPRMHTW
jgi:hypothetical protein